MHAREAEQAVILHDASAVLELENEDPLKLKTMQVVVEGVTFIGYVSAATKTKDTVELYFQSNPVLSKFAVTKDANGDAKVLVDTATGSDDKASDGDEDKVAELKRQQADEY